MAPDEKKMQRVKELEEEKARGEGSFGHALELVTKKMQLGVEETMRDHPAMGTGFGALVGAGVGAGLGEAAGKLPGAVRNIAAFMKK